MSETTTRKGKELSYGWQDGRFSEGVAELEFIAVCLAELVSKNTIDETDEALSEIIDFIYEIESLLWPLYDMVEDEGEAKEQRFLDAYKKSKKCFLEII